MRNFMSLVMQYKKFGGTPKLKLNQRCGEVVKWRVLSNEL